MTHKLTNNYVIYSASYKPLTNKQSNDTTIDLFQPFIFSKDNHKLPKCSNICNKLGISLIEIM